MKLLAVVTAVLFITSISEANSSWAQCHGTYEIVANNSKFQSEFSVSIQEDLMAPSVEFTYLFTDLDSGYMVPIVSKKVLTPNRVMVQVAYPKSNTSFANFEARYQNGKIISLENFIARDANGTTVGPLALTCL